ncbi:LOW QUALITY PROTEIN: hypothetical protein TMLG_01815, partial [Mycobacterium tuberculosis SUMu012]
APTAAGERTAMMPRRASTRTQKPRPLHRRRTPPQPPSPPDCPSGRHRHRDPRPTTRSRRRPAAFL